MENEELGGKISYGVSVEDAVVKANVDIEVDIVKVLKKQAEKSSNTIDDTLVKLVEMARSNADWKGYAKEHIL